MIEIRDVFARYPGAPRDALAGVSLVCRPGGLTAIMGGNGSGKSTLVRVMAGLLPPSRGDVIVSGRVGVVFQNPFQQVTALTVERELAFGLQNLGVDTGEIRHTVDAVLEEFGLAGLRDRAPASLSGGEMQRVALASVLITDPDVLILDEATSLLSPPSRVALLGRVSAARESRRLTVVLVTQFAQEALQCPGMLVLHGGKVAMAGSPEELFSHPAPLLALSVPVPALSILQSPA